MKKNFLKPIAFLLLIVAFFSCHKEIPQTDPNVLITNTEWKLSGFVNAKTGKLKKAKQDNEKAYFLMFNKDKTLSGFASNNRLTGSYEMDISTRNINISVWTMTLAMEHPDGELFLESLNKVDFFSLQEHELRLYYNDKQNYLLFKVK